MVRLAFDVETEAAPEIVLAALTDFSSHRPEIWSDLDPDAFEVHGLGDTWSEVTEGSRSPPRVLGRERYDWSVPGRVIWTLEESPVFAAGTTISAEVRPADAGGARVHVDWERRGRTIKGKLVVSMFGLIGRPILRSYWSKCLARAVHTGGG